MIKERIPDVYQCLICGRIMTWERMDCEPNLTCHCGYPTFVNYMVRMEPVLGKQELHGLTVAEAVDLVMKRKEIIERRNSWGIHD